MGLVVENRTESDLKQSEKPKKGGLGLGEQGLGYRGHNGGWSQPKDCRCWEPQA